jgi:glyoxylase-like metal-dependent hydrolase (beta-lactamase superfamily II)
MKNKKNNSSSRCLELGNIKIFSLSDGTVRLDGGAMFGVVPRVLWEETNPADDKNRIRLGINPLLIQTKGKNILVETGMGKRWDEKARSIYGIEQKDTLEKSLAGLGLTTEDIDIVINTHLHFDHAGGNTVKTPDGTLAPAFPGARYVIQEQELVEAMNPGERSRASYRPGDFLPIKEAGLFELVEGDDDGTEVEVEEGVFVFCAGGHNRGIQLVRIEGGGQSALFVSDIMPTATHIKYPYIAAYDLFPLGTLRVKKELIKKAAKEGWFLLFYHDPSLRCATVALENERPLLSKVF